MVQGQVSFMHEAGRRYNEGRSHVGCGAVMPRLLPFGIPHLILANNVACGRATLWTRKYGSSVAH